MKHRYIFSLMLLLLVGFIPAAARAGNPVKGKVVDEKGQPMIGVTVVEDGTTNGTTTDLDGTFSLTVASNNSVLVFSSLGYKEQKEPVGARTTFNVTLKEETQAIDDVVVVGYGVQKKGMLTASVASIGSEKLTNAPADNISNMLGGKLPGLVSRQTSGVPGDNESEIYIRGISTTGTSTPLILVDGVERDFANLDPSEIANITILKDAASAAVYGAKACSCRTGRSG